MLIVIFGFSPIKMRPVKVFRKRCTSIIDTFDDKQYNAIRVDNVIVAFIRLL